MPEDNLLSMFDNVTVDNTRRISEGDRAVCEMHQGLFEKSLKQLRSWQERLQKAVGEEPNPMYKYGPYNSVQKEYDYSRISCENGYRLFEFTPMYDLSAISKLMLNLCEHFEDRILRHFNETYGCSFGSAHAIARAFFGNLIECTRSDYDGGWSDPKFRRQEGPALPAPDASVPSYETVVDYVIESLGGMSFAQREEKEVYDRLGEQISYSSVTRAGKKVKIGGTVGGGWYDDTRFSGYETSGRIHKVLEAARIFFGSPAKAAFDCSAERYGADYPVHNSRVESFRPLKNRAVEFAFGSVEDAQRFLEFCQGIKAQHETRR